MTDTHDSISNTSRVDRILELLDVGLQDTDDNGYQPDDGRVDYDASATELLEPQEQQPFEGEAQE